MKPVGIHGVGTALACGAGVDALRIALREGREAGRSEVGLEGLEDFIPANRTRRLDPLARMALLAACLSLRDAGLRPDEASGRPTGIVFGTALGPQESTFSFLEDIIGSGDACASSFAFTNSVHNLPASNMSLALGIRGPMRTVTAFGHTTAAALLSALHWIREGVVERVLLVLGEECSAVMEYVVRRFGGGEGNVRPFAPGCTYRSRGGCAAFVLGGGDGPYGRLASVEAGLSEAEAAERAAGSDLLLCAAAGRADEFNLYERLWASHRLVGAYSPVYGSLPTGPGVDLAVAALSLRERTVFAGPGGAWIKGSAVSGAEGLLPGAVAVAGVEGPGRFTLIRVERR